MLVTPSPRRPSSHGPRGLLVFVVLLGAAGLLYDGFSLSGAWLGSFLRAGVLLFGPLLLLRALCVRPPGTARLVRASAFFLLPPCIYFATGFFHSVSVRSPWPCFLYPLGFLLALFHLRAFVRGPEEKEGMGGTLRAFSVVVVLGGAAAWAGSDYVLRFHAPSLTGEREAIQHPAPPPFRMERPLLLGPHNACAVHRDYRDLEVRGRVVLEEGALFQVRVRVTRPGWPQGVSFFVSVRPGFRSGFYLEANDAFEPLGTWDDGAPVPIPGQPLEFTMRVRGRRFEADLGGRAAARAETRCFPTGGVVALAAKGEVRLERLDIRPHAAAAFPPSTTPDRLTGALPPLLFLACFSFLAALFTKRSWLRMAEAVAFGLGPAAYGFFRLSPRGAVDLPLLAGAVGAAALLFLLAPMVRSRNLTPLRLALLIFLVAAGAGLVFFQGLRRAWPHDYLAVNRLSPADWAGDRIEADLLHLQHPLLRRWNTYLAEHKLRDRGYAIEKKPGVKRILSLGTSSTNGYWLKLPYTFRLELLLRKEGLPVECLIGAVPGGTGPRLYWFFKNALLPFHPDIVTLSLYYNDAYALSQMDESDYLKRISAPGYRRTFPEHVLDMLEVYRGTARLKRLLGAFSRSGKVDPGGASESPPARFERMLRDFAELSRAEGIRLVLIKEPVAGNRDRIWKKEFYAAMDRVGGEYGLPVVDPTPLLQARGGARLFVDNIHPSEEGAQCMAEALLPVIRDLLEKMK